MSGSVYTALVSRALFPLHERLKRHDSVAVRQRLERSQWWTAAQLEALRVERLRALLVAAGSGVPYYAELFRRLRFDPRVLRGLADLQALPLLTKAINHFRQAIETVNSQLAHQFRVERNWAKSLFGLGARIQAKLAAHTMGIYLNCMFGRPLLALADFMTI